MAWQQRKIDLAWEGSASLPLSFSLRQAHPPAARPGSVPGVKLGAVRRRTRDAPRTARQMPWASLEATAKVCGVAPRELSRVLRAGPWRGRCDELLARRLHKSPVATRSAVRTSGRCPPPLVRLGERDPSAANRDGTGTAAWAARDGAHAKAARSKVAALCALHTRGESGRGPLKATVWPALLEHYREMGPGPRVVMMKQSDAAVPQVVRASLDPYQSVRVAAAKHPQCPQSVLKRLTRDPDDEVRAAAATRARGGRGMFERLAGDTSPQVRAAAAAHDNCPPDLVEALTVDSDHAICRAAEHNPVCPPVVLERLADLAPQAKEDGDAATYALTCVAGNPNASAQLLERVIDNAPQVYMARWSVYKAAASNPACPPHLLERFVVDNQYGQDLAERVATNPSTQPNTLKWLASNSMPQTCFKVAAHPRCTAEVLEILAATTDPGVRAAAAKHPVCPPNLLKILAADKVTRVRAAAAKHPVCPPNLLNVLAADKAAGVRSAAALGCSADLLDALAADPDNRVRAAVAEHPACPTGLLEILAADTNPRVRRAAASSPLCPPQMLRRCRVDLNKMVRDAATNRPKTAT